MRNNSLKVWELSLFMALCISFGWALLAEGQQLAMSREIIRLHVVASGNSEGQQARKMQVKAAVEELLEPMMASAESAEQAARLIETGRDEILAAASAAAGGESVELVFGREGYGTRLGEGYMLPAGEYTSLRIIIGGGGGRNWWGVIFPQLTPTEAAEFISPVSAAEGDGPQLICRPGEYEISFRILEILQLLRQWINRPA